MLLNGLALEMENCLLPLQTDSKKTVVKIGCYPKLVIPSEGIEVFDRILESTTPQILVSTVDLVTCSKQESTLKSELASKSLEKNNLSAAARPTIKLSNPHTASRTEIEQILIDIWQKSLAVSN